MDKDKVVKLLTQLSQGDASVETVYSEMQHLPFKDLDFARVDTHRALRQGFPEVIFCLGKTPEQIIAIALELTKNHNIIIGTKCSAEQAKFIKEKMPEVSYFAQGNILFWGELAGKPKLDFTVSIVTAGTADLPVAEEASIYLQAAGVAVKRQNDIGIAGLHRLINVLPQLKDCSVCIVVAGMDGALPGVVAGLLAIPVIAVPTSVGYGASFSGVTPLLTMLNSCASGVTVVNIDNGFGAAAAALRIMQIMHKK